MGLLGSDLTPSQRALGRKISRLKKENPAAAKRFLELSLARKSKLRKFKSTNEIISDISKFGFNKKDIRTATRIEGL